MSFVNGFPIEDSIKPELYLVEPEQLSDLVYVPLPKTISLFLGALFFDNDDYNNLNKEVKYFLNVPFNYQIVTDYVDRNLAVNSIPCLFQKFNPYNKPFANLYSEKLFNFFNQFSNHYIYEINSRGVIDLLKFDNLPSDYLLKDLPSNFLNGYTFEELTINLPNNGLKIEVSYYYAEFNPNGWTPQYVYSPLGSLLINEADKVIFSRIDNDCIEVPKTRAWLLNFDSLMALGNTLTIRDDILVGSLVINFIDEPNLDLSWQQESKDFILNQIPDYYLYDNLDNFFATLTSGISSIDESIGQDLKVATNINVNFTFGYSTPTVFTTNYVNYLPFGVDIQPKLFITANNNNWNNTYSWINNQTDIKNLIEVKTRSENNQSTRLISSYDIWGNSLEYGFSSYRRIRALKYREDRYINIPTNHSNYSKPPIEPETGTTFIGVYYSYQLKHFTNNYLRLLFDNISNLINFGVIHGDLESQYYLNRTGVVENYIVSYSAKFSNFDYVNNSFDENVSTDEYFRVVAITNSSNLSNQSLNYIIDIQLATTLKSLLIDTLSYDLVIQAHEDCYKVANCDLEDLKKDVKEIHAALDAGKFAYLDGSTEQQRVSNIGYYVERIARVLGISVNSDGSIRSIRQSKIIEKGDTIPAGWNIAQWGRNNGENTQGQEGGLSSEERDGIAWEVKSNKFITDSFTGEPTEIAQGGYALVENIPQLLHLIFEDLDRAFGLQDAGANVVPSPDGKQIVSYQGINTMLLDILYMLSMMSRNTSGAHICGLKNQAMLQEVLGALGQPVGVKEIEVTVANGQKLPIPVPGTLPGNPTLSDMFMIILLNLGLLVGSKIDVKPEEKDKKNNS
ncbi:MAG: hypothetical protein QNJ65_18285 [Xenococcaceae cyanobacterium MO_234.B1]|nr:hypothetical protein [Xenococcaceae cyanobacterium MO_234.B1]